MKKYTPVECCLNIFEPRYWYYIPGFNGYEISNDGYVRSMKHYRRYPYGILIKPVSSKSKSEQETTDPLFILSDNNNERQRIRLSQIAFLAKNNPYSISSYPRLTIITDQLSRNRQIYITKNVIQTTPLDNTVYYPKFTIIQDGTETLGMEPREPGLIVPIISMNGDEYYGRKDCRTFSSTNVQGGPGEILSRGQ